ncbi:MAG: M20/M25/M40 family metallo-hydrolase [Candidatus Krumholzibacteria bacterium]|nr:M20/M25/M40 family metallo-hydrolase [Candidatus Krumholzibacteria bacterium]
MRTALVAFFMVCSLAADAAPATAAPGGVRSDSLVAMVRFLTVDASTGAARSRFCFRESEIGAVADSLAARLERYTGGSADRIPFTIQDHYYTSDSTFTAENIVARLSGTGALPGVFLITAHYDAIALRTDGFRENWSTMPAPGADDNASGVAGLMELARMLPKGALPFDVLFVLFSGEELGSLGSGDFVARFDSLYSEDILGVINLDMIGYRSAASEENVSDPVLISDYRSGWLTDLVAESAAGSADMTAFRIAMPGPSNYDHKPFWLKRIPAITIAESLTENYAISYPLYHTIADTLGDDLDFEFASSLANAAGDFLIGLASRGAEIAILPSDVMLVRDALITGARAFQAGDSLGVLVRVRNIGTQEAPAGASVRLTITIESEAGERRLFSDNVRVPEPLRTSDTVVQMMLDRERMGGNIVHVRADVEGMADDSSNDAEDLSFSVSGGGGVILGHGFRPNPVNGAFGEASFCVNLAREADIEISLYTLEGERIVVAHAGSRWGTDLHAGLNCLSCSSLFGRINKIASGIYIYRVVAIEQDGSIMRATGRFAIAH